MKILILGTKGNLGTQLYNSFIQEKDFEVFAWDREEVDVFNQNELVLKIKDLKPKIIINAIAYNAVDKCEVDEEEYKKALYLNAEFPKILALVSKEINSLLVHYSSDYVFNGNEDKQEFYENDKPNPVNKYGFTKRQGEINIEKNLENQYYVIRTSKLFGPKGLSEFSKKSFFDVMGELAGSQETLKVVDEELSCFTYTKDLAQYTKELIQENPASGVYHFVNKNPHTWYSALKLFLRLKNKDINLEPVSSQEFPREAQRPKYSILKNTKFKPMPTLESALRDYIKTLI